MKRAQWFMVVRIFMLVSMFVGSAWAVTPEEEYAILKGGFQVSSGKGYLMVVDSAYQEVDADLSQFKDRYLRSDAVDDFCASLLAKKSVSAKLVPFRPTLTAYISSGVANAAGPEIDLYDTSLDVGYFWVDGGGIQGGVVLYHGFTKQHLSSRFHKKFRIVFDRAFVERVTGMSAESILDKHVLKNH